MPPSQLDGREPAQATDYEYDDVGRLVRSVTRSEPRWTERDRAEVLALALFRQLLCPGGCGHLVSETTAKDDSYDYDARRTTCRACAAIVEAQRAADDSGQGYAQARLWTVTKVKG